jgi:Zn-dependent protease
MGRGLRIARIFGIDVTIHPSWILVFVLVAFTLATSWFPAAIYHWSPVTTWTVAIVSALLLFASVLVHELAHSLIAKAQGIEVRSITLFLLGGVSTIASEATSPGREALMAGAGPASSLFIGAFCIGADRYLVTSVSVTHAILFYLGSVNILLGVFNLLPGFPLDGGRVLRAVMWAITHDFLKATRWAARAGNLFGFLLIGGGVLIALYANSLVEGFWFGLIGWMVVQASRAAYQQSRVEGRLDGVSVRELMTLPPSWVPGDITLRKAANDYFLALNARCLPVQDDYGRLEGVVCVSDLQRVDQRSWGVDQVQDVMTPAGMLVTASPDDGAQEVFHRLASSDASQIAVIEDGRFVGFVDRAGVQRYLQMGGGYRHHYVAPGDTGPRPPMPDDQPPQRPA